MLHSERNEDGFEEEVVVIACDEIGNITALYDDELHDLYTSLGNLRRPRASEINENPETGKFEVDLSKSGGPLMTGFELKRDAEKAEVAWIMENVVGYRG